MKFGEGNSIAGVFERSFVFSLTARKETTSKGSGRVENRFRLPPLNRPGQVCGWRWDNCADIHRPDASGEVVPKRETTRPGAGAQAFEAAKRLLRNDFLALSTAQAALYDYDYL
jgi:hypothetical protein